MDLIGGHTRQDDEYAWRKEDGSGEATCDSGATGVAGADAYGWCDRNEWEDDDDGVGSGVFAIAVEAGREGDDGWLLRG
jgi:hypothetical protein